MEVRQPLLCGCDTTFVGRLSFLVFPHRGLKLRGVTRRHVLPPLNDIPLRLGNAASPAVHESTRSIVTLLDLGSEISSYGRRTVDLKVIFDDRTFRELIGHGANKRRVIRRQDEVRVIFDG